MAALLPLAIGCAGRSTAGAVHVEASQQAAATPTIDAATQKLIARLGEFNRAYQDAHSRYQAELERLQWRTVVSNDTLRDPRKIPDARRRVAEMRPYGLKLYEELATRRASLLIDLERLSRGSSQARAFYDEFIERRREPETGFEALENEQRALSDRRYDRADALLALLLECRGSYAIDDAGAASFKGKKAESCRSRYGERVTALNENVDRQLRVAQLLHELSIKPYRSLAGDAP